MEDGTMEAQFLEGIKEEGPVKSYEWHSLDAKNREHKGEVHKIKLFFMSQVLRNVL